ncbi:MAG: hypothetical protein GY953_01910, partial [bacterium]|nr:hypothetical protein [bacterium]
MQLVNALITNADEWKLRAVTDGGIIADGLTAQGLQVVAVDDAPNWMNGAQLLITSIRSPGTQERRLIRVARELSIPSVVLLADLGSGSAKFRDNEGWALPDAIGVADAVTWQTLAAQGIPPGILRPVGSPYLDSLAETTPSHHRSALQVCLFDVPNDLDFVTWGIAPLYSEEQVRDAFAAAVRSVTDAHALLRPHPKQIRSPDYRPRLPSEIELEGA